MPETYAFSHDPQRCIKCYSCETACKQWREIPAGTIKLRRVYEVAIGTFPNVTRTFHSVACQHCSDAPCVGACAPGAITKRVADGVVTVDTAKCELRQVPGRLPLRRAAVRPDRHHAPL